MDILLYIFAIAIMLVAQSNVNNAYKRYRTIRARCNYTGEEIARIILDNHGLHDIYVGCSQNGILSDHYDPKNRVVNLSPEVFNGRSIASIAVAAHECGHAIQHATKYYALEVRNYILPLAIVSSNFGWTAIMIGFMASYNPLVTIGIVMLIVIAAFQLMTLPVELNASKRALAILEKDFLDFDEVDDAEKMLQAAAFTYIASLISSVVNILRILLIRNRNKND